MKSNQIMLLETRAFSLHHSVNGVKCHNFLLSCGDCTVLAGRNLQHKGKSGCNAFVTMGLSNSSKKFATATASHTCDPQWAEEARL